MRRQLGRVDAHALHCGFAEHVCLDLLMRLVSVDAFAGGKPVIELTDTRMHAHNMDVRVLFSDDLEELDRSHLGSIVATAVHLATDVDVCRTCTD